MVQVAYTVKGDADGGVYLECPSVEEGNPFSPCRSGFADTPNKDYSVKQVQLELFWV